MTAPGSRCREALDARMPPECRRTVVATDRFASTGSYGRVDTQALRAGFVGWSTDVVGIEARDERGWGVVSAAVRNPLLVGRPPAGCGPAHRTAERAPDETRV
jgi:hypothetical protein